MGALSIRIPTESLTADFHNHGLVWVAKGIIRYSDSHHELREADTLEELMEESESIISIYHRIDGKYENLCLIEGVDSYIRRGQKEGYYKDDRDLLILRYYRASDHRLGSINCFIYLGKEKFSQLDYICRSNFPLLGCELRLWDIFYGFRNEGGAQIEFPTVQEFISGRFCLVDGDFEVAIGVVQKRAVTE